MLIFALLSSAALAADFDTLLADSGWEVVAEPSTKETGPIDLRLKVIDGTQCLRGRAVVDVPIANLYDVITDVPSAKNFSSETLLESKVIGHSGASVDYYQHLDVPSWTMASDRFWVLRGAPADEGTTRAFRWQRFDWRAAYPDLAKSIDTDHSSAVEPTPNWGTWQFTPSDNGTVAVYYICTNPGGSLPEWLARRAAVQTFPDTMGDVVREAMKRAGK